MEETEVVDVRTRVFTVADHGLLVEVVVGRREYEADDKDHKRPLLVEREDKVSNLDPTGFEQLPHLVSEAFCETKQITHAALMFCKGHYKGKY